MLGEPEVWAEMSRRFPWVAEELDGICEGLLHLEFGALRRGVERAADTNDTQTARTILEFVEELLAKPDAIEPEVRNAIDVSFVEDLYLGESQRRAIVAPLLGPQCSARWHEVAKYHDGSSA